MLVKWRPFIFAVVAEMNGVYFNGENAKNLGFTGFLRPILQSVYEKNSLFDPCFYGGSCGYWYPYIYANI